MDRLYIIRPREICTTRPHMRTDESSETKRERPQTGRRSAKGGARGGRPTPPRGRRGGSDLHPGCGGGGLQPGDALEVVAVTGGPGCGGVLHPERANVAVPRDG